MKKDSLSALLRSRVQLSGSPSVTVCKLLPVVLPLVDLLPPSCRRFTQDFMVCHYLLILAG